MPLPLTGRNALRYGRRSQSPPSDTDATAYFIRAGVTEPNAQQAIAALVTGLKAIGLWGNLAQAYLMQAAQNRGSGATVYGLLLGSDGTIVNGNGSVWGTNGLLFDAGRQQIVTTPLLLPAPRTTFAVATLESGYDSHNSGLICFAAPGTLGDAFGYAPAKLRGLFTQGAEVAVPLAPIQTGFNTITSSATTATRSGTVTLGTFSIVPKETMQGTCAAVLFFNRLLTSGETSTVYALMQKSICATLGMP